MLEQLAATDFDNLPGGTLPLVSGEADIVLEIAEVRQFAPSPLRETPPFSITLRERGAQRVLPQGVYEYRHPVHGSLLLFTVPIGPDAHGMRYEIILS